MKETREETYRKVFIKSEADLPKIEDIYYVHIEPDNRVMEWFFHIHADHRQWLKYIDWYLQPVTDKEATGEQDHTFACDCDRSEINDEGYCQRCGGYDRFDPQPQQQDPESDTPKHPTSYRDFTMTEKQTAEEILLKHQDWECGISLKAAKEAMEEYASQSQSSVLPSEEEIEKAAIKAMQREEGDIIHIIDSPYASAFIDGVKWFKSQLKQGFEKEFFIWHLEDANNFFPQRNEKDELVFWDMSQNKGITLDELYQYWIDNVKDK